MRSNFLLGSLFAALALAGCSSSTTPSTLDYTDPTSSGWRLVKDVGASTSKRLVLDLVGPSGTMTRGVGFNIQAPAGIRWSTFTGGLPAQDTGVFELKNSLLDPTLPQNADDPILFDAGVMDGNVLTAGIFQKDRSYTAKDAGKPLMRIAIELIPTSVSGSIPLTVKKAKMLPGDIGSYSDTTEVQVQKSVLTPIVIAVGTVHTS